MRTKIPALALAIFATVANGCGKHVAPIETAEITIESAPTPQVDTERFIDSVVKGVRLGDSEKDVLERLGKPVSRKIERRDYCGISELLKLKYEGLEIWLDRGTGSTASGWAILETYITKPDIPIRGGVVVGDTLRVVKKKLGRPNLEEVSGKFTYCSYYTSENDNLSMDFKDGVLEKIRYYINPC